jgi:hypothetical protein
MMRDVKTKRTNETIPEGYKGPKREKGGEAGNTGTKEEGEKGDER